MTDVFQPWPKTPRLFKDMTITEKIDGTNACVVIRLLWKEIWPTAESRDDGSIAVIGDDPYYAVYAQSRKRLITPEDDNYSFAGWVQENAENLVETLGEGYHYGEWWGWKINRGYGLPEGDRRFSLFNVNRYGDLDLSSVPGLGTVPVLCEDIFDTQTADDWFKILRIRGSYAAPGYDNPEGIIVFHSASGQVFKVTDNGDSPKWAVNALKEAA